MEMFNNIKMANKITFAFFVLIIFLGFVSCKNKDVLFQENSEDWYVVGNANWGFIDNELVGSAKSGSGFIVTKQAYENFNLELDFMPDSDINSGIFIRCKNDTLSSKNCYELNIWDNHPNQENRTGAVVNMYPPLGQVQTIGKWNTFKVMVNMNHLKVWVNNVLTINSQDDSHIEGYIGLQAAGSGEIRFKNVKISELK